MISTTEKAFESVIKAALVQESYQKRSCQNKDYDPELCLIPADLFDFIIENEEREDARLEEEVAGLEGV